MYRTKLQIVSYLHKPIILIKVTLKVLNYSVEIMETEGVFFNLKSA